MSQTIDPLKLLSQMLDAFLAKIGEGADTIRGQAEAGLRTIAEASAQIAKQLAAGEIDKETAERRFKVTQRSAEITLLSMAGIAVKTIENAINAAIGVAKDALKTAVGLLL
jgi:hypothetical protein